MSRPIQKIVSLFLLTVFLYGTVGVSVYIHVCHSSGSHDIFFYPEVFGGKADCGCVEDTQGPFACPTSTPAISTEACCFNSHLYFKADFEGNTISPPKLVPSCTSIDFVELVYPLESTNLDGQPLLSYHPESPPPLFVGKRLITSLHQFKIPTPIS